MRLLSAFGGRNLQSLNCWHVVWPILNFLGHDFSQNSGQICWSIHPSVTFSKCKMHPKYVYGHWKRNSLQRKINFKFLVSTAPEKKNDIFSYLEIKSSFGVGFIGAAAGVEASRVNKGVNVDIVVVVPLYWLVVRTVGVVGALVGLVLVVFNPIPGRYGQILPTPTKIPRNFPVDTSNVLIFHDFVSLNILWVPLSPFFKKVWKFWRILKTYIFSIFTQGSPPLKKKWKNVKKWIFPKNIILFQPEFEFYMSLAFFFDIHNTCFAQNFQIFIFF